MKRNIIVANWKSNKTESEAKGWLQKFKIYDLGFTDKEIVVCPSFNLLPILKSYLLNHKSLIKVGAQNISPFDEGAYTGEVSAKQIKEFADYVIIGHSERRNYFREDEEMINKKISLAYQYGITPIICVSNISQIHNSSFIRQSTDHNSKCIVAYEPLFAIGSGTADTPENADQMAKKIKDILGQISVLYGGSVTSKNVKSFTQMPNIDGALVGGASLDPLEFLNIIKNA